MANNIAVSITADVADLQAKRAILSQELKTAQKDLNDFAKAAKTGGMTDELKTSMLGAGDAVAKAKAQIRSLDAELKRLTQSTHGHNETLGLNRAQFITAQSAVMRFTDSIIAGQSPIRAFALEAHKLGEVISMDSGGMAGGMAKLTSLITPMNIGIAAGIAVFGAAVFAGQQYEETQKGLIASSIGLGAVSGLTADQLRASGEAAATWRGQSVAAASESASAFAAAGVQSQASITALSGDVQVFAQLTGEKAADAQKELASAMQDPIKGAQDLNDKLGILDATQMEQIRTLTEAGDKNGAVAVLVQALQVRMDEARAAGVGLSSEFQTLANDLSNLWGWLGKVNSELQTFQLFGFTSGGSDLDAEMKRRQAAAAENAHIMATLNQASAGGAAAYATTPEGRDEARRGELLAGAARARQALIADIALRGEHSDAAKRDLLTLNEYTRALTTFIPAAEKAHRIAELDAKIAVAKRGHDKAKIQDLTQQRALLNTSGEVMSPGAAAQQAHDAGAVAADRTGAGRTAHGPSVVAEWQQQLHAQEIASGEFFKDQTATELAFWQSKIGLVKAGSREWLEVQGHIYELQKKTAHEGYADHIATLNDQIQADRDNWAKQKADWDQKLTFIAEHYGQEGKEYRDAHREFLAAEHQHNEEMARAQRDAERSQLESLKSHMQAMRAIREQQASTAENVMRADSGGSPIGDIKAAQAAASIRLQLDQQELADLAATYAAEDALRTADEARALAAYTADSAQYKAAVAAKAAADQQFADRHAALEARMRANSIQSILAIQQAYHGYVDGMVSSSVSGLTSVLTRQKTWQQAMIGVWNSLLGTVNSVLTKMATNWIIKHVLMSATQKAELAAQTGAHVASEGVKTAATATGASSRAATEVAANTAAMVAQKAIAASQVATLVGLAGAGGVASMAAAPFPIDLGAPAFGASMAAAAAGFGSVAAFAKGTNELPTDMMAQIHAGERIVPAADNAKLLAAVDRGTGGGPSGATHNNITYAPQISGHMPFRDQLRQHESDVVSLIKRAMRDGALKPAYS